MKTITREQRIELVNTPVTLDGRPAKIVGLKLDFPKVKDIKSGVSWEWSWQAVARIVAKGGAFHS